MKTKLRPFALCVAALGLAQPSDGAPIRIAYVATDLGDVQPGKDAWAYQYFLSGAAFEAEQGFAVSFDAGFFTDLQDPPPPASTNGADYELLDTPVTIPAGSASVDLPVLPIDDSTFELPESVILTLAADPAYTIATASPATVVIADNDARVTLTAMDRDASEAGADPGVLSVTREGPTTAPLAVFYVVSGSATHGVDYEPLPGSITIPSGAAEETIAITPIDDALVEGPETVVLNITANPAYAIGLGQASVTIADDERPAVTVVATDDVAGESGPGTGTFTVTRAGPTGDPLTVLYAVQGTAENGVDYEPLAGSVTIPAGSATAAITVTPVDDALFEGSESVILTLSSSADYVVVIPGIASLTVLDDDGAVVTIVASDPTASEAGPDQGAFTIARAGGDLSSALIVLVARSGTADNGSDYGSLGGATFAATIPAGETSVTIAIVPFPDAIVEGSESVILTISPRAVYVIGTPGAATVTISDS